MPKKGYDFLMRPFKKKSDTYRRLGTVAVLFILIFGIAFVCYTYHTQNTVTKQYLHELSIQSAQHIRNKVSRDLAHMNTAVTSMEMIDNNDDPRLIPLLESEMSYFSDDGVIRLSYIEPNCTGTAINAKGEIKNIALPPDTDYIRDVVQTGEKTTMTIRDSVTGNMVFIYALPIKQNNMVVGVHCGVFSLDQFTGNINSSYFNNDGHQYVVDQYGNPIFLSDDTPKDAFFDAITDAFAKHASLSRSDSVVARYDKRNYWITYTPVQYSDWYLLLTVPNSSINGRSERVVIFSVIVLLSMLLTSVLFLRHMDSMQAETQIELYSRACLDEVTGIFNKTGFAGFVDEVLFTRGNKYALAYFDFDNFKAFNDLFGYSEGDSLLKHTAEVLAKDMGEQECCARVNGDNFYALLTYDSQSDLEKRINKLMADFSEFKFSQDTQENATAYEIICHCGIFQINDLHRGKNIDFYIDRAKIAIAQSDKTHSNSFIYYDDSMRKNLVFEAELENDLKRSLKNHDFKVYVQPKHSVITQKIAGGEALIRWQHPTKGFLTPNKFVDIFERNGQITEIDFYVLEEVCKMQREWMDLGIRPIVISVNQSRMHFYKQDYYSRLKTLVKKYNVEPKYIELEITETVAMSNTEMLAQATQKLHKMGFRVSIDDFGAGQSSLNVLKDIDADVIKLDRGFFIALSTSPKGKEIITTVVGMASRLNIETVSEGIETKEQFDFIYKAGCDLVQGFLFGKPMPIDEFSELFKESL